MTIARSNLPKLIALCGNPKVGKSTIQSVLQERYGIIPQDDAYELREACKILYGLTDWHVTTQEGKASEVEVLGQKVVVRKLLGEFGKVLEAYHGQDFIPDQAIKRCLAPYGGSLARAALMSFGSVRRSQGRVYKRYGGLVLEVCREGFEEAANDFDRYDKNLVDIQIWNPGPGAPRAALVEEIARKLDPIFPVISKAA